MHFNRPGCLIFGIFWLHVHCSNIKYGDDSFECLCVCVCVCQREKERKSTIYGQSPRCARTLKFRTYNDGNSPCIDVLPFVTILNLLFIVLLLHSLLSFSLVLSEPSSLSMMLHTMNLFIKLHRLFFSDSTIFPYLERER